MYEATRGEGFGAEVKRRVLIGTYVLSAGYYDAYYNKARRVRSADRSATSSKPSRRSTCCLPRPRRARPPFPLGEKMDDPIAMYPERHLHRAGQPGGAARYLDTRRA